MSTDAEAAIPSTLAGACPRCFPDAGPLEPHTTVSTGATLRADYRCGCGAELQAWWDGSPWPVAVQPLIITEQRKAS